jgi:hypothetical protein
MMSLNSGVNFGEIAFAPRSALKGRALYQGTALAVPEADERDGL